MEKVAILQLLRSKATVFSFKDLLLASGEKHPRLLKRRLSYYVARGELYSIRRGLYAKDKDYDKLELATKVFTPSYVSFETVLSKAGIIFQHYTTIFVASYQTKEIDCDGKVYAFRKIKEAVLTNGSGIMNENSCSIATQERAFLDVLYLNKNYHFDNLSPLDWEKVFALLPLYNNKQMSLRVHRYWKAFQKEELV